MPWCMCAGQKSCCEVAITCGSRDTDAGALLVNIQQSFTLIKTTGVSYQKLKANILCNSKRVNDLFLM